MLSLVIENGVKFSNERPNLYLKLSQQRENVITHFQGRENLG